jgi:23S rRNA A2030 N6-methylase RlmJ
MLRVNPPRHYWDTHAGSAWYRLTDSPSRRHGALRFLAVAPVDPDLAACAYLDALRDLPGRYPGSAALAMRALGNAASCILCDVDPVSAASLETASEGLSAVVVPADGVAAIERAAAARRVDARDVLVHVDPFDPRERVTAGRSHTSRRRGSPRSQATRRVRWASCFAGAGASRHLRARRNDGS